MKVEKIDKVSDLRKGDVIRNKEGSSIYVVVAVHPEEAIAVKTLWVSNPTEWERLVIPRETGL